MSGGYYITESGERFELKSYSDFEGIYWDGILFNKNIVEIVIPDGNFIFLCHRNKIKSLVIPPSFKVFICDLMDGIEVQYRRGLSLQIHQKR